MSIMACTCTPGTCSHVAGCVVCIIIYLLLQVYTMGIYNNKIYLLNMLKIYIAINTTTATMLVSNLPCWKFENKCSMPMACTVC